MWYHKKVEINVSNKQVIIGLVDLLSHIQCPDNIETKIYLTINRNR